MHWRDCGGAWQGQSRCVCDRQHLETTLVQARGWINASGVGFVRPGCASHDRLGRGMARLAYHHRVAGTVAASRQHGGLKYVMARRVEFVYGPFRRVLDCEVVSGR